MTLHKVKVDAINFVVTKTNKAKQKATYQLPKSNKQHLLSFFFSFLFATAKQSKTKNMKTNLENWTPAQVLVLQNETDVKNYKLIKYTFFDLVMKDVLRITHETKSLNRRDKPRTYKYITIGKNFHTYPYQLHETIFLNPFLKNSQLEVLFRNLIKSVLKEFRRDTWFHQKLVEQTNLNPYFHVTSYGFWWFKGYKVKKNPQGERLCDHIQQEMKTETEKILNHLETNDTELVNDLKRLRGNVFLLKEIDFQKLEHQLKHHYNMDKEIWDAFYVIRTLEEQNREYDSTSGCSGGGCGGGIDTEGSSEDGCFGSDDSGGDSGCSSGDSGCGGCGGCGGD